MERIRQQMDFLHEIDKVKDILRAGLVLGKRRENDAEHSWHMCMVALTMKEYFIEECNLERILKMILIHDIVEIYAGDTPAFGQDRSDKREAEESAARRVFSLLPEDQAKKHIDLWLEFEDCETNDAKYANACDKYQGFMQNLTSDGHTWKKYNVHIDKVLLRSEHIKLYLPKIYEEFVLPEIKKYMEKGYIRGEL